VKLLREEIDETARYLDDGKASFLIYTILANPIANSCGNSVAIPVASPPAVVYTAWPCGVGVAEARE